MKFNLTVFSFLIIVLGWISLFQIFAGLEESNLLKSHLIQDQLRLLNTCQDILRLDDASQSERLLECYHIMENNLDLILLGGEYGYLSFDATLSAEKSQTILMKLSNYDKNLNKVGQLIEQISSGTLNASSINNESITKLSKQIVGIGEHFELKSKDASNRKISFTILLSLITIGFLILSSVLFKKKYLLPIERLNEFSDSLNHGNYKANQSLVSNNQFDILSQNLGKISKRFQNVIEFIERISGGNLDSDFEVDGNNDLLGTSLLHLKDELKKVNKDEQERNWANEGLTKFNDIIHDNNDDINALAQDLISELVKYVSANQGAIFQIIEEEDEQMLELMSTYAWGRRKFVEKKLDLKSNLIGQAVLEREYLFIKNVPKEFVNITSGLGEATPRSVLILPLIFNDVCCGAIELASFSEFDEKQISFLNKLSENIASAILNLTGNTETKKLLKESQLLTEQLKMQEEELRQNEEELEAAQENLSRKLDEATQEMKNQLNKVEAEKKKNIAILEGSEDGVIMFKENGIIEFINSTASDLFNVNKNQMLGKQIGNLLPIEIVKDEGESKVYYTGKGQFLPITLRTEITLEDDKGDELSLLVTTSEGKVESDVTFAFFIQRISVELF